VQPNKKFPKNSFFIDKTFGKIVKKNPMKKESLILMYWGGLIFYFIYQQFLVIEKWRLLVIQIGSRDKSLRLVQPIFILITF
jgi:hypothetical protein